MVFPVYPEPREGGLGPEQRQGIGRVLLVDVPEEVVRRLERGHQQRAVGQGQPVDRLQPVPRPGLDALRERVVHADGDVHLLGLVARHVLLELFLAVRHDGEVLGGNAVALRAVTVAAEGDAPAARLARGQDDAAADAGGQVLLADAPVDVLTGEMRHADLLGGPEGGDGLRPAISMMGSHWSAGRLVGPHYASATPLAVKDIMSRNTAR